MYWNPDHLTGLRMMLCRRCCCHHRRRPRRGGLYRSGARRRLAVFVFFQRVGRVKKVLHKLEIARRKPFLFSVVALKLQHGILLEWKTKQQQIKHNHSQFTLRARKKCNRKDAWMIGVAVAKNKWRLTWHFKCFTIGIMQIWLQRSVPALFNSPLAGHFFWDVLWRGKNIPRTCVRLECGPVLGLILIYEE